MSETPRTVTERITGYLTGGGLLNPELANHTAVRDLLIDARDELAQARAEVARLILANEHWHTRIEQEKSLREKAEAENKALREDAERYRWLREHCNSMSVAPPLTVARVCGYGLEGWSGDDLDAAIDRERQREAK